MSETAEEFLEKKRISVFDLIGQPKITEEVFANGAIPCDVAREALELKEAQIREECLTYGEIGRQEYWKGKSAIVDNLYETYDNGILKTKLSITIGWAMELCIEAVQLKEKEIEQLREKIACLEHDYYSPSDFKAGVEQARREGYEKGRKELAKEIFSEIDDMDFNNKEKATIGLWRDRYSILKKRFLGGSGEESSSAPIHCKESSSPPKPKNDKREVVK